MGSKPLCLLSTSILCGFCKFCKMYINSLLCYGCVLHLLMRHVHIFSFSEHLLLDQPPLLVPNKMSVFLFILFVYCA